MRSCPRRARRGDAVDAVDDHVIGPVDEDRRPPAAEAEQALDMVLVEAPSRNDELIVKSSRATSTTASGDDTAANCRTIV